VTGGQTSGVAALGGLMEAGRVSAVTGQQGYGEGIMFAAAVIGGVILSALFLARIVGGESTAEEKEETCRD
jgi:hypothetical protein